jgi:putative endopeptidase
MSDINYFISLSNDILPSLSVAMDSTTRDANLTLKVRLLGVFCSDQLTTLNSIHFGNLIIGNMVDWWSEDDSKEYESRVKVMVEQASGFQVHGQSVKGSLTSGENIADLGGLRLALRGLINSPGFDPNARIDGFTPVQRFFLSWAQCWRQNILEARALQLLTIDPVSLT